jgi:hypothetical protein
MVHEQDWGAMNLIPITSLNGAQTQQLYELYQGEWWTQGRKLEDVAQMLQFSDFVFGYTQEDGNWVAFARVLTDRVFKALVLDVIVARSCRKNGLGRRLLNDISTHPILGKVKHIELYCLPELVPFYEQWGFSCNTGGIVLMRRPNAG